MISKRITMLLFAAAMALVGACKEDEEEEETGNYLVGTLLVDMPAYVQFGDKCLMKPYGVYHPEARELSDGSLVDSLSYYYVNPFTKDTVCTKSMPKDPVTKDPSAVLTIASDSLGLYGVYWTVRATDYYSRTTTVSFNIVSPDSSIKGFAKYPEDGFLNTSKHSYRTTVIGGKTWTRSNLCETEAGGCAWSDCEVMSTIFGRYYTWSEAVKACPPGWHLPSSAEWDAICPDGKACDAFFNVKFNGTAMYEYYPLVGDPTDKIRISVMPVGYVSLSGKRKVFSGLNKRAVFWTSSEKPGDSEMGIAKCFYESSRNMLESYFAKDEVRLSVRCVAD